MLPAVPLSLALAGLDPAAIGIARDPRPGTDRAGETRELIIWASSRGVRAVQLNAAAAGVRPRDLDRSARRDLAATLRRHDLSCSGIDLWIPPEHFTDPAHVERAVSSVLGAIDLAHDLATLAGGSVVSTQPLRARVPRDAGGSGGLGGGGAGAVVSLTLPAAAPADVLGTFSERALGRSVRVADHAWPASAEALPAIDVGLDPATILFAQDDPARAASMLGGRVASARVSDLARGGTLPPGRVAPSPGGARGRLDLLSYLVALHTAGYPGHAVIDLRGVPDQAAAIAGLVQAR